MGVGHRSSLLVWGARVSNTPRHRKTAHRGWCSDERNVCACSHRRQRIGPITADPAAHCSDSHPPFIFDTRCFCTEGIGFSEEPKPVASYTWWAPNRFPSSFWQFRERTRRVTYQAVCYRRLSFKQSLLGPRASESKAGLSSRPSRGCRSWEWFKDFTFPAEFPSKRCPHCKTET